MEYTIPASFAPYIDNAFERLSRSAFRSRFHLGKTEIDYYNKNGKDVIAYHALDFIRARLAPALPQNEGKQTPMRGHPVFIAQHATATCCRSCLEKWYKIPKGRELTGIEIDFCVAVIMKWIEKQIV